MKSPTPMASLVAQGFSLSAANRVRRLIECLLAAAPAAWSPVNLHS